MPTFKVYKSEAEVDMIRGANPPALKVFSFCHTTLFTAELMVCLVPQALVRKHAGLEPEAEEEEEEDEEDEQ